MDQLSLPILGLVEGAPRAVATSHVKRCTTYRQAVRYAWEMRRIRNMSQRDLAWHADLRPQLISDYLNADDKPQRKSLPAERIAKFEEAVGNTLVSQWIASASKLTVLEEMVASRQAA